ncbi:MAG: ABC transporter permease [Patescibacteria group bacterium]|jgi:putative ABC transport system permease protein
MIARILEYFRMAFRAILGNIGRSLLTVLGVVIGVVAILTLIGLGAGVKREVTNEVDALGPSVFAVISGDLGEGSDINPTAAAGASTLTNSDVLAVQNIAGVEVAAPLALIASPARYEENAGLGALVVGITPDVTNIIELTIEQGRFINEDDMTNERNVLYVGDSPRQQLFPGMSAEDILGEEVMIGTEAYEVIGVAPAQTETSVFGGSTNPFSGFLAIPYATAEANFENTQIFRILGKATDPEQVDAVTGRIEEALLASHGTKDFSVFTQADLLGIIDNILSLITNAIVGIGAISLVVGGIGIMNIMLVSVTERTKEIGLRKSIGASNSDILIQFLLEALLLSLLGGLLGLAISGLASLIADKAANIPILIDGSSVFLAVGFSVFVGIVFGVAPAIRASRLNPIDALRYE